MDMLDAPAGLDELRGEPVEQFRVRGRRPLRPRFSGVATIPTPKCACQIRFTWTRAMSDAARSFGSVSQFANASRRPVVRAPAAGSSRTRPRESRARRAATGPSHRPASRNRRAAGGACPAASARRRSPTRSCPADSLSSGSPPITYLKWGRPRSSSDEAITSDMPTNVGGRRPYDDSSAGASAEMRPADESRFPFVDAAAGVRQPRAASSRTP